MKLRVLLIAGAAALIGACMHQEAAAPDPAPATPPAMSDSCPAAQFASLVGRPESEIPRASLPAGARVICHNCPVTMDYRPDRLNIEMGADGNVARVRCG